MLTLGNLAAGMVSIVFSANDHFTSAAWASSRHHHGHAGRPRGALDGRDQRIRRGTGLALRLGDIRHGAGHPDVSGGAGTAGYGPAGRMRSCIFFAMAAVLRLARFNLKAKTGEPSTHFMGLPVPAAAGILASFVLSYELFDTEAVDIRTVKTIPIAHGADADVL